MMKLLLSLLAIGAAASCQPAYAQTTPVERVEKARAEVNTAENALGRALYALDKALEALRAPTPEPDPDDHDGHEMPEPPAFTPLTVDDIKPIHREVGLSRLKPTAIPTSAAPDILGAFRFTCNASHLSYDDAIAYPGQPGVSHLHMFYGNPFADAFSTYASLRNSTGGTTCQGDELNRSAYWVPALLDGRGNVVLPDVIVNYYKRLPDGAPACNANGHKGCVDTPTGLRAIFGTNYVLEHRQSPHVQFDCGTDASKSATLALAVSRCAGATKLYARINAPDCWDGVNLDSPDHQSHLSYRFRDAHTGQANCPATHPYIIPAVTFTLQFTVEPGDDPTLWKFSSDVMADAPAGSTFHADFMEAHEPVIRDRWHRACIGKMLNCSDGNLGDGFILPRPEGFTFEQRPRLVPVPAVGERLMLN